jgi:photolyase PhrII
VSHATPIPPLPDRLSSRLHRVATPATGPRPEPATGGGGQTPFVLYWLRTAQRAHENPALDVALTVANHLGLPVLVYHALSERYPFASDRHHRFILEGAVDVAREMAARGITHVFHLEREGHRGSHLATLASRAALVVTEDLPITFLERWTTRLAETVATPVWAVDTSCLVPFRQVPRKVTDRAFRFRSATAALRSAMLTMPWPEVEPLVSGEALLERLPFQPLELGGDLDLDALVASCAVDHAVAPVPGTRGGSGAGYRRWEAFRERRLRVYHRTRNDPLRDGVSRMSPYLHYGMVSPFRLAREAAEVGGEGAEKYLDELLVWRELAHAFCVHNPNRDTVQAIPPWALETLREHMGGGEGGRSPGVPTLETLARARTGDGLWDAAQRSLLIHGELHNNVRMTWGKALLGWSRTPEEGLARLLDLNHRYALDGRDPSSYGGILWCMGQFDRPFPPPVPTFGTVRPRRTADHARRLDVERYTRATGGPAHPRPPRTVVIGAGVSGLACARTLADHGIPVVVLDKGRLPGGRISTRTLREDPDQAWDHGAQFFTARDPRFRRHVESWVEGGVAAPWEGRIVRLGEDGEVAAASGGTRFVGTPGMRTVATHLAVGLDVRCGVRVLEVRRQADGWWLDVETMENRVENTDQGDRSSTGPFDAVVVAVPAPQAAPLLSHTPLLSAAADGVVMAPCWAAMLAGGAGAGHPWDAAFLDHPVLSWVARQGSRPGRDEGVVGGHWVLHASPEWSERHLEEPPEEVERHLRKAAGEIGVIPGKGGSGVMHLHRWRYALPPDPHPEPCLWDRELGIGACGDWCGGPRVEGAFLSGLAMAGRILAPESASLREGTPEVDLEGDGAGPGNPQGDLFGG